LHVNDNIVLIFLIQELTYVRNKAS
jgi:hypothetical protein